MAVGGIVSLSGLGLGCGDIYASWKAVVRGAGSEPCDRLSDLGTPTWGHSPVALTLVSPVACVCGFGTQVQGRGASENEKVGMGTTEPQRGWHCFVPPGGP